MIGRRLLTISSIYGNTEIQFTFKSNKFSPKAIMVIKNLYHQKLDLINNQIRNLIITYKDIYNTGMFYNTYLRQYITAIKEVFAIDFKPYIKARQTYVDDSVEEYTYKRFAEISKEYTHKDDYTLHYFQ